MPSHEESNLALFPEQAEFLARVQDQGWRLKEIARAENSDFPGAWRVEMMNRAMETWDVLLTESGQIFDINLNQEIIVTLPKQMTTSSIKQLEELVSLARRMGFTCVAGEISFKMWELGGWTLGDNPLQRCLLDYYHRSAVLILDPQSTLPGPD
jgi:hypothetical protein